MRLKSKTGNGAKREAVPQFVFSYSAHGYTVTLVAGRSVDVVLLGVSSRGVLIIASLECTIPRRTPPVP